MLLFNGLDLFSEFIEKFVDMLLFLARKLVQLVNVISQDVDSVAEEGLCVLYSRFHRLVQKEILHRGFGFGVLGNPSGGA